jgi:hypothetical protein
MGYVRFALAYPGRFRLMFRKDRLLADDPRLLGASEAAYRELERGVREFVSLGADAPLTRPALAAILGAWSLVHGFAELALEGKLDPMAGPNRLDRFVADMLPDVLAGFRPALDVREPS